MDSFKMCENNKGVITAFTGKTEVMRDRKVMNTDLLKCNNSVIHWATCYTKAWS